MSRSRRSLFFSFIAMTALAVPSAGQDITIGVRDSQFHPVDSHCIDADGSGRARDPWFWKEPEACDDAEGPPTAECDFWFSFNRIDGPNIFPELGSCALEPPAAYTCPLPPDPRPQEWAKWDIWSGGAPRTHCVPANWTVWQPAGDKALPGPDYYDVYAVIPPPTGRFGDLGDGITTDARYVIYHDGATDQVSISHQVTELTEVFLGKFYFNAGGDEHVYLDDINADAFGGTSVQNAIALGDIIFRPSLPPGPGEAPVADEHAHGMQEHGPQEGDPVTVTTGNFTLLEEDVAIPGLGDSELAIRRFYNARSQRIGHFGLGWSSVADVRLQTYDDGSATVWFEDGQGRFFEVSGSGFEAGDGVFDVLESTATGWLLTTPDQWTYEFETFGVLDAQGRVVSKADRHGNTVYFSYASDGRLASMSDDSGRSLSFAHSGGRVSSMTDPAGRTWSYSYVDDSLVAVRNPRSAETQFTYGGSRCLTSITDPTGILYLRNVYEVEDDRCRVVEQYDTFGSLSTFSYSDGETFVVDNLGNGTTYRFDEKFRRTERIDALGQAELFEWNDDYQLVSMTDRRGNTWNYSYDDRNNRVQEVCPTGCTTDTVFDPQNDPTEVTNPIGNTTGFEWSGGLLVGVTQADATTYTLGYDAHGQLISSTDPNGNTTTLGYDGFGNLTSVSDPEGNTTTMAYDVVGRRTSVTDGNGHTRHLVYDDQDNVIARTDAKGQTATMEYDLNDKMTKLVDRRGGEHRFEWDEHLRLTAQIDPEGHRTEYEYSLMHYRTLVRDPRGHETKLRYDDLYRLVEIEDALGQITRFEYDSNGNLSKAIDPLGGETEYAYEPRNLLDGITDALEGETSYLYDDHGRMTSMTNARGAKTRLEYDVLDRIAKVIDAEDGESLRHYDPASNLIERVDQNGHATVLGYDRANRLASILDPEEHLRTIAYDGASNPVRLTNERGAVTEFFFDANDNLRLIKDALEGERTFAYNEEDLRTAVTDENGNTTSFFFNLDSQLIRLLEAGGQESHLAYGETHNMERFTNAKGHATLFEYDALNRRTASTNPLNFRTEFTWDPRNRVSKILDPEGHATEYEHDLLDRLVKVTDALSQGTHYSWDPVGNLEKIVYANGEATEFVYDFLDRNVEEKNAVASVWRNTYDGVGNLVEHRNARGQTVSYSYDKDDMLVQKHFPDKPSVSYGFDEAHNLVEMVDSLGTTTQAWDLLNRLESSTNHIGQEVVSAYDKVGNRISFRHEDGSLVSFEYDQNNRQSTVTDPTGNVFVPGYDLTHNLTDIDYPNSTTAALTYDAADRLVGLVNQQDDGDLISQFDYTLDRVGNRTQTRETYRWPHPRSVTTDYLYDPTYRLKRSSDDLGRFNEYQYDGVGNRLLLTSNYDPYRTPTDVPPYTVASTFDEAHRLATSNHSVFGTALYEHDPDGNRIRREGPHVWTGSDDLLRTTATFDSENRVTWTGNDRKLRRRWKPLDETIYTYDGFDRLFRRSYDQRQGGGGTKWSDFVYDGLRPVSEHVEPSPQYTNYHRGLGRLLSQREKHGGGDGNLYYYHHDGLGSVSALTKHNGQSVHAYRYSDFGTPLDNNGRAADSSNFTNPHNFFTYTGQEWVEETWQYHFHAREYDAVAGVWARADDYRGSLREPYTLHRYQYVGNNPVNFVDLFGYARGEALGCSSEPDADLSAYASANSRSLVGRLFGSNAEVRLGQLAEGLACRSQLFDRATSDEFLERLQVGLDACGLVPGYGEYCDVLNVAIYGTQGDYFNALISSAGLLPVGGQAFTGSRTAISLAPEVSSVAKEVRDVSVYLSRASDGTVQYVGITNDLLRRAAEHFREKGIRIQEVEGLQTLTRADARAVEQVLIETLGLQSQGGLLYNKINSISPTNPIYREAIERGAELLRSIGMLRP